MTADLPDTAALPMVRTIARPAISSNALRPGAELMPGGHRGRTLRRGLDHRHPGLFGEIGSNGDRLVASPGDSSSDPDPTMRPLAGERSPAAGCTLADPASWLPGDAWEDPEIKPYVHPGSRSAIGWTIRSGAPHLWRRSRQRRGPAALQQDRMNRGWWSMGRRHWVSTARVEQEAQPLAEALLTLNTEGPVVEHRLVYQTAIGERDLAQSSRSRSADPPAR
jgi:hypothetical protein